MSRRHLDFELDMNVEGDAEKENFRRIREWVENSVWERFVGEHFEIVFTQAETNFRLPHFLGFAPKDVVQTSLTGAGAITWNYGLFDRTDLDMTVTDACTVRAFIGRFEEK
jgi:hypothetical protein